MSCYTYFTTKKTINKQTRSDFVFDFILLCFEELIYSFKF